VLAKLVALCGLLFAAAAHAQVSGSFSLVSDYRFRGVSLSDDKPAAQLNVAYDHPSGWYAGAFGSTVRLVNQSGLNVQILSYFGYAQRVRNGLSWDAGAGYAAFSGSGDYNYPEVHLGIGSEHLSASFYHSWNYLGQGQRADYAELNGARPVLDRVHLLGHIGVLQRSGRSVATGASSARRVDIRAGIGVDVGKFAVQLTWVASGRGNAVYPPLYPVSDSSRRSTPVLSLSRSF
jgi:uncharacterized protein (TIGR02001 family)